MKEFNFDTIMYPINFGMHYLSEFEVEPLQEAKKQGMGIISIKTMSKQKWQKGADRSICKNCWYEPLFDPQQATACYCIGHCRRNKFRPPAGR